MIQTFAERLLDARQDCDLREEREPVHQRAHLTEGQLYPSYIYLL